MMAVQSNVGKPGAQLRRAASRFTANKKSAAGTASRSRYPMAYWCEFEPAYGFHEGFVYPIPRTPWLRSASSRGGGSALRFDQDRDAGGNREIASRGPGWQSGSQARSSIIRTRPARR